jgi:hypothetical protein
MVKTVTWAGEAKKFYEENKGKNGIHSFSDALKSPELKKQYKLAKKHHKFAKKGRVGGYGEEEQSSDNVVNNEGTTEQDQAPAVMDGGNEIDPASTVMDGGNEIEPEPTVMDGGNDDETPAPQMDGGKRKKSARRTKKSKKSKTVKKQRKHKK